MRTFSSTLLFYSAKAYEYVRKTFCKGLPHEKTVRRWFSNISGDPGFSLAGFQLLEEKAREFQRQNKTLYVATMLDEMSIKKQVDFDSSTGTFKEYCNLGYPVADIEGKLATDALIIMVVGINAHFKVPIGYFFIAGN